MPCFREQCGVLPRSREENIVVILIVPGREGKRISTTVIDQAFKWFRISHLQKCLST
jgi:hypothetical protein